MVHPTRGNWPTALLTALLLVLRLGLGQSEEEFKVIAISQTQELVEGATAEFSCRTNRPFELCAWERKRPELKCLSTGREGAICEDDPRIHFQSGRNSSTCSIIVAGIVPDDSGRWLCLVRDNLHKEEASREKETRLKVISPFNASLSHYNGSLVCTGQGRGDIIPQIMWQVDTNWIERSVETVKDQSGMLTVSSRIDNPQKNVKIRCLLRQRNTKTMKVVFESSHFLTIEELMEDSYEMSVSGLVLVVVILAVMIILLALIINRQLGCLTKKSGTYNVEVRQAGRRGGERGLDQCYEDEEERIEYGVVSSASVGPVAQQNSPGSHHTRPGRQQGPEPDPTTHIHVTAHGSNEYVKLVKIHSPITPHTARYQRAVDEAITPESLSPSTPRLLPTSTPFSSLAGRLLPVQEGRLEEEGESLAVREPYYENVDNLKGRRKVKGNEHSDWEKEENLIKILKELDTIDNSNFTDTEEDDELQKILHTSTADLEESRPQMAATVALAHQPPAGSFGSPVAYRKIDIVADPSVDGGSSCSDHLRVVQDMSAPSTPPPPPDLPETPSSASPPPPELPETSPPAIPELPAYPAPDNPLFGPNDTPGTGCSLQAYPDVVPGPSSVEFGEPSKFQVAGYHNIQLGGVSNAQLGGASNAQLGGASNAQLGGASNAQMGGASSAQFEIASNSLLGGTSNSQFRGRSPLPSLETQL